MSLRKNIERNSFKSLGIVFPILALLIVLITLWMVSSYQYITVFNWQGIRKELRDSIEATEHDDFYVGFSADTIHGNIVHRKQTWIVKHATVPELLQLRQFPNGRIKAIAYWGLIVKNKTNNFELIMEALDDKETKLQYRLGCIGEKAYLGEFLIENMLCFIPVGKADLDQQLLQYNLTNAQYKIIMQKRSELQNY